MAVLTTLVLTVAAAALVPAMAGTGYRNPEYPQPGWGLPSGCIMLCDPGPGSTILPPDQPLPGCIMLCDDRSGWMMRGS
ncbi:hypothetical protein ACIP5Y_22115 [Nocardia sp. NPDC088792]|uniref:hypothetical protein n=1 Tax=Nocardia sp. NPDC088792 TaxID=3364332 RepID=UPI00380883C5